MATAKDLKSEKPSLSQDFSLKPFSDHMDQPGWPLLLYLSKRPHFTLQCKLNPVASRSKNIFLQPALFSLGEDDPQLKIPRLQLAYDFKAWTFESLAQTPSIPFVSFNRFPLEQVTLLFQHFLGPLEGIVWASNLEDFLLSVKEELLTLGTAEELAQDIRLFTRANAWLYANSRTLVIKTI